MSIATCGLLVCTQCESTWPKDFFQCRHCGSTELKEYLDPHREDIRSATKDAINAEVEKIRAQFQSERQALMDASAQDRQEFLRQISLMKESIVGALKQQAVDALKSETAPKADAPKV